MTEVQVGPVSDDEFSDEAYADPYSFYGRLRETDPVHWNAERNVLTVTGYDNVSWVMRNHTLFLSEMKRFFTGNVGAPLAPGDEPLYEKYLDNNSRMILRLDRPEHFDKRMVFQKHFTPKRVEEYRPFIDEAISELLDEAAAKGTVDVVEDIAEPLPVMMMLRLLDLPRDVGRRLRALTPKLVVDGGSDPHRMRPWGQAFAEFCSYVEPVIDRRLEEPTGDVMSSIAEAERSGIFTRKDSLASVAMLFMAGHETTICLISNGVLDLARNPEQYALLRSDPERYAAGTTEECVRYQPPVRGFERIPIEDTEVGGRQIRAGDRVRWVLSSANRDPAEFADPDRLNITRDPNPHLVFGTGIHFCLGVGLARLEGQEMFRSLAERFSNLRLEVDEPVYHRNFMFRALEALPVRFEA